MFKALLLTYAKLKSLLMRLSNLALLHIEREYINKVISQDMDKIIDAFGQGNGRNKYFY